VYCSAGYGCGAGAVQISKSGNQFTATELWTNSTLQNQWSTPVSAEVIFMACSAPLQRQRAAQVHPVGHGRRNVD